MKAVLRDYRDSWTSATGREGKRARRAAAAYYFLVPTFVAGCFVLFKVSLPATLPFLSAVSIFTALLFGLLILVFNTAVALRKDGNALNNAHGLNDVISDLRATITYTIGVALVLVGALAVATLFMVPVESAIAPMEPSVPAEPTDPVETRVTTVSALAWQWTPPLAWLSTHMLLNVLKILERIRTAFNYISR